MLVAIVAFLNTVHFMMLLTPKSEVEIVLYDMSKFSNKWQGIDFPKNGSLS